MQKKALIVLNSFERPVIRLVDPVAKEWIERPIAFAPLDQIAIEEVPQAVRGDGKYRCTVSRANPQMSRAWACHGASFNSFLGLIRFIRDNDIDVVYEFVGFMH